MAALREAFTNRPFATSDAEKAMGVTTRSVRKFLNRFTEEGILTKSDVKEIYPFGNALLLYWFADDKFDVKEQIMNYYENYVDAYSRKIRALREYFGSKTFTAKETYGVIGTKKTADKNLSELIRRGELNSIKVHGRRFYSFAELNLDDVEMDLGGRPSKRQLLDLDDFISELQTIYDKNTHFTAKEAAEATGYGYSAVNRALRRRSKAGVVNESYDPATFRQYYTFGEPLNRDGARRMRLRAKFQNAPFTTLQAAKALGITTAGFHKLSLRLKNLEYTEAYITLDYPDTPTRFYYFSDACDDPSGWIDAHYESVDPVPYDERTMNVQLFGEELARYEEVRMRKELEPIRTNSSSRYITNTIYSGNESIGFVKL